jgi:large subunit ribosomal protein L25
VTVEALPMAIPDRLEVEVTALDIGGQVRVADIVVPEGATVLDDPESVVATVAPPRVELPEEEEEAEEALEGEEAEGAEAEAEAPAAEGAETEGEAPES